MVKYWKFSKDEYGQEIVELISNTGQVLILKDHYVNIWKLIDGSRNTEEIITILTSVYLKSSKEEIANAVNNCLKELDQMNLVVTNWNPLG